MSASGDHVEACVDYRVWTTRLTPCRSRRTLKLMSSPKLPRRETLPAPTHQSNQPGPSRRVQREIKWVSHGARRVGLTSRNTYAGKRAGAEAARKPTTESHEERFFIGRQVIEMI